MKISKDHNKQIKSLDYIFIDDDYILEMNKKVLNHDYYTDIITFDYSENNRLIGEIYISLDSVLENSKKYKDPFHVELSRVIFHGILHMVGYNDKSKTDKKLMREKENYYLEYIKN